MNNRDLDKEVKRLVHQNRYEKGIVCTIDILMQLNYLNKMDYDNWRFGRVSYLEKVCKVNLSKLTLINKLISQYSAELDLKASWTAHNQYGKGANRRLRFSKSGDQTIEDRYATHYVDKNRIIELKGKKTTVIEKENNDKLLPVASPEMGKNLPDSFYPLRNTKKHP